MYKVSGGSYYIEARVTTCSGFYCPTAYSPRSNSLNVTVQATGQFSIVESGYETMMADRSNRASTCRAAL
jgi:hypothetical protein